MKTVWKLLFLMISTLLIMSGQANANEAPVLRHTVTKGQWLTKIARQFPETNWVAIAKVNNLKSADLVYPGQVLIIPAHAKSEVISVKNSVSTPVVTAPQLQAQTPTRSAQKSAAAMQMYVYEKNLRTSKMCSGKGKNSLHACITAQKNRSVHASKKIATPKLAQFGKMSPRSHGSKFANNRTHESTVMHGSLDRYTTATVVVPPESTLGDVANPAYLQLKHAIEDVIGRPDLDVTPLVKVMYQKYRENENSILPSRLPINQTEGERVLPNKE